jgi:hypothetical protein
MAHDTDDDHDSNDQHDWDEEPQSNLPVPHQPRLPQLFRDLGLGNVNTSDTFTIKYSDGTLKVAVKRKNGVSQTVQRNVSAGFRAITEFDPAEMASKDERNAEIRKRYKRGATQQELGELFGLSQPMISRIIAES